MTKLDEWLIANRSKSESWRICQQYIWLP